MKITIKADATKGAKGHVIVHTHAGGDIRNHVVGDETVTVDVAAAGEQVVDIPAGCSANLKVSATE